MSKQIKGNRQMKKKTKKMRDGGGANLMGLANQIEAGRRQADRRESRPERQEAEYSAAQQRRREEGGLSRLAMIPEAVRRAQMRAMDRLVRGEEQAAISRTRAEANALERQLTDSLGRKNGGVVKKKKGGVIKKEMGGKMNRGDGRCIKGKTKGRMV
tara:strand:+ start:12 stop:482 length:471 start_codon:yes stop_codon:yes gene_type:complete